MVLRYSNSRTMLILEGLLTFFSFYLFFFILGGGGGVTVLCVSKYDDTLH